MPIEKQREAVEYYKKHFHVTEIARVLDTTADEVRVALLAAGIPVRAKGEKAEIVSGTFGFQLRIERQKLNQTPAAFSERTGISTTTLKRLETGAQEPTCAQLRVLSAAIGIPPTTLAEWVFKGVPAPEGKAA